MNVIHIWEFPYNVSVRVKEDFLNLILLKIKKRHKTRRMFYFSLNCGMPFNSFKEQLKPSSKSFRNLSLFVLICKRMGIPLGRLEESIISYRTVRGHVTVKNPILPVKVNALFSMLIAHTIADGNCWKGGGRGLYFNYRQYDKTNLINFLRRVESVFGKLEYKKNYFFDLKRIYLPTALSSVLAGHYNMKSEDFLSDRARIPGAIFKNKSQMLAVLVAFIIDEGTVDSAQVVIRVKNKGLIDDLSRICMRLGYEHKITKKEQEMPSLYILMKGVKKFWRDFQKLKKKHPEISMSCKEERINDFVIRKKKIWRTAEQGSTKNKIIRLLKEKPMSINELSKILLVSRQGIRWHVKELEKLRVITTIKQEGKLGFLCILKKYKMFSVKNRGKSKQYDITNKFIIKLLKQGPKDTKEIFSKAEINRNTLFHFLAGLENNGKIKRIGKRIYKTHPTAIWALK